MTAEDISIIVGRERVRADGGAAAGREGAGNIPENRSKIFQARGHDKIL